VRPRRQEHSTHERSNTGRMLPILQSQIGNIGQGVRIGQRGVLQPVIEVVPPSAHVVACEAQHVARVADILAHAFEEDAAYRYLMPDLQTRLAGLRDFFERNGTLHLAHRCISLMVDADDRVLATVTVRPPGGVGINTLRMVRLGLLPFALAHGVGAVKRLFWLRDTYDALEREAALGAPHLYVHMMAVHPRFQGQGLGGRMLMAALATRAARTSGSSHRVDHAPGDQREVLPARRVRGGRRTRADAPVQLPVHCVVDAPAGARLRRGACRRACCGCQVGAARGLNAKARSSSTSDDARALALGCTLCPDLDPCGGLRIRGGAYDCRSLCACQRGAKRCSGVCRGSQREFIRRAREACDHRRRSGKAALSDGGVASGRTGGPRSATVSWSESIAEQPEMGFTQFHTPSAPPAPHTISDVGGALRGKGFEDSVRPQFVVSIVPQLCWIEGWVHFWVHSSAELKDYPRKLLTGLAPQAGFEPATLRLTE